MRKLLGCDFWNLSVMALRLWALHLQPCQTRRGGETKKLNVLQMAQLYSRTKPSGVYLNWWLHYQTWSLLPNTTSDMLTHTHMLTDTHFNVDRQTHTHWHDSAYVTHNDEPAWRQGRCDAFVSGWECGCEWVFVCVCVCGSDCCIGNGLSFVLWWHNSVKQA